MAMTPSPWHASQRPPLTLNEKRPGLKPRALRLGHHREQLADEREHPGVGRRVRARRPADRRLIDLDDLVDELDAVDAIVRARLGGRPVDRLRQRPVQDVVDERGLARAADAGDRGQRAERNRDVDVLQVVRARAADDDLALRAPAAATRGVGIERSPRRYAPVSEPWPSLQQLVRRALEDDVAAMLAGAGPEIDHVVGRADRLLVVLDDDDRVAEVAQARQRRRAACGCRAGAGRSTARRARTARR